MNKSSYFLNIKEVDASLIQSIESKLANNLYESVTINPTDDEITAKIVYVTRYGDSFVPHEAAFCCKREDKKHWYLVIKEENIYVSESTRKAINMMIDSLREQKASRLYIRFQYNDQHSGVGEAIKHFDDMLLNDYQMYATTVFGIRWSFIDIV